LSGFATTDQIPVKASAVETAAGTNDDKFITPFKLLGWWTNIKTLAATISGLWNFTARPTFNGAGLITLDDVPAEADTLQSVTNRGSTTTNSMRIDGSANFSQNGAGYFAIDYPGIDGGRFLVDSSGNVTVGVGKLKALIAPTVANDVIRLQDLGTGWANYADTVYTSLSPFTILDGATAILPNNAGTILNSQIPTGVTSFYNSTTQKITPENNGDYYIVTVRFKGKTTAPSASYLDFGIDIGGALGLQFRETKTFSKGAGIEHQFSIVVPLYTAATFISNGGQVKITSGNGDITLHDISFQIDRTHKAK